MKKPVRQSGTAVLKLWETAEIQKIASCLFIFLLKEW